ncbi:MAG: S1 RNA-binding domain-containing protein, partial [Planctomycetes bacterium]|nr:S1 RNA-binding domain-containing protein [Planctomycetota bacterium]
MHDVTTLDCSRIAQDLQIRKVQVEGVVQLLDEGNTIPFIARYRRERTGGLKEEIIRHIQTRIALLRQLSDRKQTILKSIEGQGRLTEELRAAIRAAETTKRLEDLYLPYKAKKKSPGTSAREAGLERLALAIWSRDVAVGNLVETLPSFVDPDRGLASVADVQTGVHHILAEMLAEAVEVRAAARAVFWETGKIYSAKSDTLQEGQGHESKDYFNFSEALRQIPAHRILALNRGEKENTLKLRFECNADALKHAVLKAVAELAMKGQRRSQTSEQRSAASEPPAVVSEQPAAVSEQPAATSEPVPAESGAAPTDGPVPEASAASAPANPAPAAETSAPSAPAAIVETPPAPAVPAPMPDAAALPAEEGEPLFEGCPLRTPHASFLRQVIDDALTRLLIPGLEKEIRQELTDEAEGHAVTVFAVNLRSLLLQPPLRNRRVLAIDPGLRAGCRLAVLDEAGNLLDNAVMHPHGKKPKGSAKSQQTPADKTAPVAPAAPAAAPANESPAVAADAPPPAETPAAASAPEAPAAEVPAVDAPAAPSETPAAAIEATPAAPTTEDAPAKAEAPTPSRRDEAKARIEELVVKHGVSVVAIGNGMGCRETEEMLSELIASKLPDLVYAIVNEAGASVYAISPIGREEFPEHDTALRSTISIGRRLQDPMAELVKVEPQNVGVGLYQHDVKRKDLKETLEGVVESCVNHVGVDVNTAGVPLLRYVSGLNQMVARDLVAHRKQHGPFRNREQLLQHASVGPIRFAQAAGFLQIKGGDNPLDGTWIHPESYGLAEKVLSELGHAADVIFDAGRAAEFQSKLRAVNSAELAGKIGASTHVIDDILDALAHPGRDPRDDRPAPIFKKGVLQFDDLKPGMELKGTVLNVVDFGAFIDIGLKESGLVHISQLANRYIKSPYDVVAVNDVVAVWVLAVDRERHRVSLTMIKPGTERKAGEKRERPPARGRAQGQQRQPGQQGQPAQQGQQGRAERTEAPATGEGPPRQGDRRPPRRH